MTAHCIPIRDHAYHAKTDAELLYIQRDAHEAAIACKFTPAELKYLDQVNDASTVLYYRRQGGKYRGPSC